VLCCCAACTDAGDAVVGKGKGLQAAVLLKHHINRTLDGANREPTSVCTLPPDTPPAATAAAAAVTAPSKAASRAWHNVPEPVAVQQQ
jgi:hypothetical protein